MPNQDGNQDVPLHQKVDTSQLLPDYPDYYSHGADDALSSVSATETAGSQEDTSTNPTASEKKGKKRGTTSGSMLRLLFRNSVIARSCKLLVLSLLLITTSGISWYCLNSASFAGVQVWILFALAASVLTLFAVISLTLHVPIWVCHANGWFANSSFLYYLTELEVYVAVFLWLIALTVFMVVFGSSVLESLSMTMIKLMICALLTTALLALKTHYMTRLAMSFNYSNYKERIQQGLLVDRVLRQLHKARAHYKARKRQLNLARTVAPEFGWSSVQHHQAGPASPVLRRRNSAENVGGIQDEHTTQAITAEGFLAQPSTVIHSVDKPLPSVQEGPPLLPTHHIPDPSDPEKKRQFTQFARLANRLISQFDTSSADFRQEISKEAHRQAAKIFKWIKRQDRNYLIPADMQAYVRDERELRSFFEALGMQFGRRPTQETGGEAHKTAERHRSQSPVYALGWTGATPSRSTPSNRAATPQGQMLSIYEHDLRKGLESSLRALYSLAKSMQSIEQALRKIDTLFTFLVLLSLIIIVTVAVGDAVQLLLALSTMLSGAAFVFGTSAKNTFESLIFLLVIHPFDVGDRVYVQLGGVNPAITSTFDPAASCDNLVVAEMHLLSTVFERWDGVRVYAPNNLLAYKPIFNVRRSGPIIELQRLQLSLDTPFHKLETLRSHLRQFLLSSPADFLPEPSRINLDSLDPSTNRMHVSIVVRQAANFQDFDVQLKRRSRLLGWVRGKCEELGITFMPPVQRIKLVGVEGALMDYATRRVSQQ